MFAEQSPLAVLKQPMEQEDLLCLLTLSPESQ